AVNLHTDDDACLAAQIINDHEGTREHEEGLGNILQRGSARRRILQALDIANDIVAEIADCAVPELTQLRHIHRLVSSEQGVEIGERILWATRAVPAVIGGPVLDDTVAQAPRTP